MPPAIGKAAISIAFVHVTVHHIHSE